MGHVHPAPTRRRAQDAPVAGPDLVDRPRLLAALDAGADARLTLVSGPAGSGKSVLLAGWAAARAPRHSRTVVLDASAGTVAGLWAKLSAVLPPSGRGAAMGAPETAEALAQRLTAMPDAGATVLILDDAHLADGPATREVLAALIAAEAGPRVILSSRIDPGLALQRLRLAGELVEVRGADLCFTPPEAAELLERDGTVLAPDLVRRLCERTEGWAAGLRLAALALHGHPDPVSVVEDFAGDDRAIVAYLIEEVLDRQSDEARELLLATAVVDHVSPPLADALTGRCDAARILDDLLRANAFIVPLDRRGEWYRYHALFADLLRSQLARRGHGAVARQHRRAAHWFAAHDEPARALGHAVLGEDWDGATAIMADSWLRLRAEDGGAALDHALAAIPAAVLPSRPYAELVAAVRACDRGDDPRTRAHLRKAGRSRAQLGGARRGAFVRDLSLVRLVRAVRDGDVEAGLVERPLIQALEREESSHGREAAALANLELGRLLTASGSDDAEGRLRVAATLATEASRPLLAAEAAGERAWLHALDGQLRAAQLALDALVAGPHGTRPLPVAALQADALVAATTGALEHARQRSKQALASIASQGATCGRLRALGLAVVDARLATASETSAMVAPAAALKDALDGWTPPARLADEARAAHADLLVALGRPDDALTALGGRPASRSGALAAARLAALLALGRSEPALAEGAPLVAETAGPLPATVAVAALTAVAAEAEGDRPAAARYAEHALDLAEPEGVRLPLSVAAAPLEPVLRRLLRFGTAHRSLIGEVLELAHSGSAPPTGDLVPPAEPLSDRELMVLRYLPTLLSSAEIAGELFVTVNTVKSHLKSIYRKLDVGNRREAVERARSLGLIAASGLSLERRPERPVTRAAVT